MAFQKELHRDERRNADGSESYFRENARSSDTPTPVA